MKAWPQAIGEETTRVLRAAQKQNEELQKTEAAAWHHERGEWVGQTLEALGRGQAIAKSHAAQNTRQEKLIERQEKQQEVWILGMSRERLKALGGALGLFLFGAIFGGIIYLQVGPMSQIGAALRKAETNLSTYQRLWDATTAAEQKKILKRLEEQDGRAVAPPADLVAARGQLAAAGGGLSGQRRSSRWRGRGLSGRRSGSSRRSWNGS